MIILNVDSSNGKILRVATLETDSSVPIKLTISAMENPNVYSVDISSLNITEDEMKHVISASSKYLLIDGVLKRTPYITLELDPTFKEGYYNSHDTLIVPINKSVPIVCRYNDPDNIGFLNKCNTFKIKDRMDLLSFPYKTFDMDKSSGEFKFDIQSETPGAFEVRIKDIEYFCYFETLKGKFKKI